MLEQYINLNPHNERIKQLWAEFAEEGGSLPSHESTSPSRVDIHNVPGFGHLCVYIVLAIGVLLTYYVDSVWERFDAILDWLGIAAVISAGVCVLVAVLLGAMRQFSATLLANAYPVETTRGTIYLGTIPVFWLSSTMRIGSWLLVGVSTLWMAGVFSAWARPRDSVGFGFVFFFVVFIRWTISAMICRKLLDRLE